MHAPAASVPGEEHQFSLNGRMGGHQRRSGNFEADKNLLTPRRLMSYIYGAPILDVSRSHTTTQHSR